MPKPKLILILLPVIIVGLILILFAGKDQHRYSHNYIEDHKCSFMLVAIDIPSQLPRTVYKCSDGKFYSRTGDHTPPTLENLQENQDVFDKAGYST